MKIILFLLVLTFIVGTSTAHALFGHTAAERQRRVETEQRLEQQQTLNVQQQQTTTQWQMAAFALGAGVVVALIVGTAIGSKTREDHANASTSG